MTKKKKNLLIIGAGGHAKSCLEVLINNKEFEVIGFTDNKVKKFLNYRVLGSDRDIHKLKKNCDNLLIGLGGIKDIKLRIKIYNKAKKLRFKFPKIISKNSYVSNNSIIKEGTIIMNDCLINSNVKIGKNSIINNKVLLEHDVEIGNNTHVSTGAIVNGGVKIGDNVFIGSGTIIKENIVIKSGSIIGMGSIVVKNIDGGIFYNKI